MVNKSEELSNVIDLQNYRSIKIQEKNIIEDDKEPVDSNSSKVLKLENPHLKFVFDFAKSNISW